MFHELNRVNNTALKSEAQKLCLREVHLTSYGITTLHRYRNTGNLQTTRIMMAAIRYVASGSELLKLSNCLIFVGLSVQTRTELKIILMEAVVV
jgi:hypothetical protein